MDARHDYTRRYSLVCMHAGQQQVSRHSQHYQQNGPNVHLPFQKQTYIAPKEEVVWSVYNHTVAVLNQADATGWYVHIGENPEQRKSA